MAFALPSAQMGFVGYCQFLFSGNNNVSPERYQARVTNCDLQLSQSVNTPDITDIRYDRNVYTIQPEQIGGTISFPVVLLDAAVQNRDPTKFLYEAATERDFRGRLDELDVAVKYAARNAAYLYQQCQIDSFTFSARQQSTIDINVGLVGKFRIEDSFLPITPSNSQIATWRNVHMDVVGDVNISGEYFREITVRINNNLERFFTANGKLQVQDIAPRQRDVNGTFTVMGRHKELSRYARDNPSRCLEDSYLEFGYIANCFNCNDDICLPASERFTARIPNMVYEVEEISMSNDLIETIVKWHSVPTNHNLNALEGTLTI